MGEFVVSAGTPEKRMYWLQQLQKARREFSAGGAAAFRNSVNPHQVCKYIHRTSVMREFSASRHFFKTNVTQSVAEFILYSQTSLKGFSL